MLEKKKKECFLFLLLKVENVRLLLPCAINRNLYFNEFDIFGEKFYYILIHFLYIHVRFRCTSVVMVNAHWQSLKTLLLLGFF